MKIILAMVVCLLLAIPAHAQDLKLPTAVFAASVATDWTSTGFCEAQPSCHEANPMFAWAEPRIGAGGMIALGVTTDAVTLWALHRAFGHSHPRVLAIGLYIASAARVSVALHNAHVTSELARLTPQGLPLNVPSIPLSR